MTEFLGQKSKVKNPNGRRRLSFLTFAFLVSTSVVGCQQRMATQPAPRPYEPSAMFPHGQSARPLEKGVVHRNQPTDDDPLASWLTAEGKRATAGTVAKVSGNEEAWDKNNEVPQVGAPQRPEYFVAELPFEPTEHDLKRGQTLYNAACALCHGAAGYGNGKIPERGFLRPPSYHTDPEGKEKDWSTLGQPSGGDRPGEGLPMGNSRGFYRWGLKVPLKDVPLGYIVQVISWGYGGMGSHDTQIPDWADRWRVAAYVRALQMSQAAEVSGLPPEMRSALDRPAPAPAAHGDPNQSPQGAGNKEGHK